MSEITYVQVGVQGPAGPSAHGDLTELTLDQHLQYHTDARGDVRYTAIAHASDTNNPHATTALQVGADATGTAAASVSAHAGGTDVHAIASVTGLQTALDGKAGTGHDHTSTYAPIAEGVTNGDLHSHSSGDGDPIAYADLTGKPTLGTASAADIGVAAGNVVVLDGSARLPAVDGSQLTNLPIGPSGATQAFGTIVVSGQSNVVADAAPDTLNLVGVGAVITTDASTDTITITTEPPGAAAAAQSAAIAACPAETSSTVGALISGSTEQTTLGDTDKFSLSVSSVLKWTSWEKLKVALGSVFAPSAKGVTNGDSHNHNGGDGAQIDYANISGLPTLGSAAATSTTAYDPAGSAAAAQSAAIAACPAETTTTVGTLIDGSTAKTAISTSDLFGLSDVSASNVLKKATLQNLIDSIKTTSSFTQVMKFPTWPAGTGLLMASLVASSTASRTSNIVTITATAHNITTGTAYVGFRFYYPGSPSLAAGWYDSILTIPDANTLTFSAPGADFGSESINSGAAWTTATDMISLTIPGNTLKDQSSVTCVIARDGGSTSTNKSISTMFGGSQISFHNATTSAKAIYKYTFICVGTNKQWATQLVDQSLTTSTYITTKNITTSQTFSIRGTVAAAGEFLVVHRASVEITF